MAATMRAAMLVSVLVCALGEFYPQGHWDRVTKLTTDNFDGWVKSNVDAGKTAFAPAWNDVSEQFSSNPDVVFGDINLSEQQIRGNHNPGAGGWPTIKYFNKATGYQGAAYSKKTDMAMCSELGPGEPYMQQYVEEAGSTSLCNVATGSGCSEKEMKFAAKWQASTPEAIQKESARLQNMKTNSMKADLKKWVSQRVAILKQLLSASDSASDEL